jgi:uncharacterized protein (TIGR02271 family)
MALHKIKEFYPDYRDQLDNQDIIGYGLYSGDEKIGSVDDLLVDDEGRFRYLVINTGAWIFGKKVLLPIGQTQIDYGNRHVNVNNLTREQVENLPAYDGSMIDHDYEERVRDVYRPIGTTMPVDPVMPTDPLAPTLPLETSTALNSTQPMVDRDIAPNERRGIYDEDALTRDRDVTYDRDTYSYDRDPGLFGLNNPDHQTLKLYEERLIANKTRAKTGEVAVGKRVETEAVHVSVPIEKERVVVERVTPTDSVAVAPGEATFHEGEVARMEVYEETPDIRKEAFVREEVNIRKEVDRDMVEADETLRKEHLDIDKSGNPVVRN